MKNWIQRSILGALLCLTAHATLGCTGTVDMTEPGRTDSDALALSLVTPAQSGESCGVDPAWSGYRTCADGLSCRWLRSPYSDDPLRSVCKPRSDTPAPAPAVVPCGRSRDWQGVRSCNDGYVCRIPRFPLSDELERGECVMR
jgi:hypothetical protein